MTDDRSDVKDRRARLADVSTSSGSESAHPAHERGDAPRGRDDAADPPADFATGPAEPAGRLASVAGARANPSARPDGVPRARPNLTLVPAGVDRSVVDAFIARAATRRAIQSLVAASVAPADVDDLVQTTCVEAVRAAERTPPESENALPKWLETIASRVVADHLARRARRAAYEGPMPDADADGELAVQATEPAFDPRATEPVESEGWLFYRWLQQATARDPRDRETLAMFLEHFRDGVPYARIAEQRGLSLTALSSRIFEFKAKYSKRYKRRRDRMFLWFVLGAAAVVIAVVAWWLTRPPPLGHIEPDRPIDTAPRTEPPPSFNQALPPTPAPPPRLDGKPGRR